MSLKGRTFSDPDLLPAAMRNGQVSADRVQDYVETNNTRWAIVKECSACDESLVAEEVVAHALSHAPEHIRSLARDIQALSPEVRLELFELFNVRTGKLKNVE
jgi:hypothetical protein